MIKKAFVVLFATMSMVVYATDKKPQRIDLSGTWQFCLDREGLVTPDSEMVETIQLPGTTDTNRKGDVLVNKDETTRLSRPYSYKGRA